MADNEYDEYRERLVVEMKTVWPPELRSLDPQEKTRIAKALHANPKQASKLRYIRLHTGFAREITATPEDVEQLKTQT